MLIFICLCNHWTGSDKVSGTGRKTIELKLENFPFCGIILIIETVFSLLSSFSYVVSVWYPFGRLKRCACGRPGRITTKIANRTNKLVWMIFEREKQELFMVGCTL